MRLLRWTCVAFSFTALAALPARTPKPIIDKLHADIVRAWRAPDVSEALARQGAIVQPESPAAFAQHIREERDRIAGLARTCGIRIG
jgi:tripartite-type tricarboxylate transporter receptor subunit TctC